MFGHRDRLIDSREEHTAISRNFDLNVPRCLSNIGSYEEHLAISR